MDIPVRIVGGETVLVTFTGVGYDQRIMGETLPVRDVGSTTVPDKQVVQVPKQVCFLLLKAGVLEHRRYVDCRGLNRSEQLNEIIYLIKETLLVKNHKL